MKMSTITRNEKKKHKKRYWIIPSIVVLLFIILWLFFPFFFKIYFSHKVNDIEEKLGMKVIINDISLKRNSELMLSDCKVYPLHSTKPLLCFNQMKLKISYFRHWKISPHAASLFLDSVSLSWSKKIGDPHFPINDSTNDTQKTLPEKIIHSVTALTEFLPEHFDAHTVHLLIETDSALSEYFVDSLKIIDKLVSGIVLAKDENSASQWKIEGKVDPEDNAYEVEFVLQNHSSEKNSHLAILGKSTRMSATFQRLKLMLHIDEWTEEKHFCLAGMLQQGTFSYPGLSEEPVNIDSASFLLNMNLSPYTMEIDSTSSLVLNGFSIHPYFMYKKNEKKHIVLKINEKAFEAKKFFDAMPSALFQVVTGLGVMGEMNFSLLFDCDYRDIENLKFDVDISGENITLSNAGQAFMKRYNEDFVYVCEEHGVAVKEISISKNNPAFVPFDKIPFYLRDAILASEDPSFFRHRGFIKSSIREAMVVNIERGKFSRGGSTISMQFVKNLFLNKKKVASRKFEEMLLVWLIESEELISKERMFEIYVNIIEWGPSVYGITDAARFYFDKPVGLLTFGECVYLATLVRSPKLYARTIDQDGTVTPERRTEMHFIANRMLERGMVTTSQYSTFNSFVQTTVLKSEDE